METSSHNTAVIPPRSTSNRSHHRSRRSRDATASSSGRRPDKINDDASPPHTPKGRNESSQSTGRAQRRDAERMRRLETHGPPHGTFLDDITPVDGPAYAPHHRAGSPNDGDGDSSRDSHDLTYGNITRNSVVDNMLLSLDSFGVGNVMMPGSFPAATPTTPTYYDRSDVETLRYGTATTVTGNTRQYRGHTYTSSYSSDFDLQPDYDRSARPFARGRNGVSASSARTSPERRARTGYADAGAVHSHSRNRGKKGSKSSTSSSFDYGYHQILGSMRRAGLGSRSASFDYGYAGDEGKSTVTHVDGMRRPSLHGTTTGPDRDHARSHPQSYHHQPPLQLDIGSAQGMDYYSNFDDAAPTPTVPAGPRRGSTAPLASPAPAGTTPIAPNYPPPPLPPSYAATGPPTRRNSTKSSSSRMGRKKKSAGKGDDAPLDQFTVGPGAGAGAGAGAADLAAPSPSVSYNKSSTATASSASSPAAAHAPKESRPGFFRRVFGSSKSTAAAQQQQQLRQQQEQQQKVQQQLENAQSLNVLTYRPAPPPSGAPPAATEADMHRFGPPRKQDASRRPKTQPTPNHIAGQLKTGSRGQSAAHGGGSSHSHAANDSRSQSRPATNSRSRPSTHDGNEEPAPPPQTLMKKGSSFFRRRKKSIVSEADRPPMPAPLQIVPPSSSRAAVPAFPSPRQTYSREGQSEHVRQPSSPGVSSLRKVMGPFLSQGPGHDGESDERMRPDADSDIKSPHDIFFDSREEQSPVIPSVASMSANPDVSTVLASDDGASSGNTSTTAKRPTRHHLHDRGDALGPPSPVDRAFNSSSKLRIRHAANGARHRSRSPPKPHPHDDAMSFLADSSGAEDLSPHPPAPTHLSSRSSAITEVSPNQSGTPSPTFGLPDEQSLRPRAHGKENVHPRPSKASLTTPKTPDNQALSPILSEPSSPPPDGTYDHLSLSSATTPQRNTSRRSRQPARMGDGEGPWPKRTASLSGRSGSVASRTKRVWLEPSSSEEQLALTDEEEPKRGKPQGLVADDQERLRLPLDGARAMDADGKKENDQDTQGLGLTMQGPAANASSASLPVVKVDTQDEDAAKAEEKAVAEEEPDEEDRARAQQIFDGDESFLKKDLAAAWLGERVARNVRTRKAYMELFDWSGYNILLAFRDLCTRLVVKAESQQLDRVIDAFSQRWCACNATHGFKSPDVVHTIAYSVLMLNTDLHLADIDQKMTRSQFVKNTLPTIRRIADESAGELAVEEAPSSRPMSTQFRLALPFAQDFVDGKTPSSPTSPTFPPSEQGEPVRASLDAKRRSRSSPHVRGLAEGVAPYDTQNPGDACTVLVHTPYKGNMKGWEAQLEVVLREFYNSIRSQRLPLHGVNNGQALGEQPSSNSLGVVSSVLRRTPSVLSKAPSDTVSYRGRGELRTMTGRWLPNKTRSRPRLTPGLPSGSTMGSSSRTSLDDGSVWSPAGSFSTWSKHSLAGPRAHGSFMSVESFGSAGPHGDYQQSIGFANALSQAIIREESMSFAHLSEEMRNGGLALLEDESLELEGPPWAKEGILQHRHHLERLDRAGRDSKKDKGWSEVFAVVEKGVMRLFLFKPGAGKDSSAASKSLRIRSKKHLANLVSGSSNPATSSPYGAPVGGGNWLDNAEPAGEFVLRQTLASALPPPGFSPSRPHVWALSLPTGAVHLFQAGTPEIVAEWVSTANYWSARLSKAPLAEAVSNVEYGWGDAVVNAAAQQHHHHQRTRTATPTNEPPSTSQGRTSRQSMITSDLPRPSTTSAVGLPRPSFASHDTGRTSLETSLSASNVGARASGGPRPGDRAVVHEWQPPIASMMASDLREAEQLATLAAYVTTVEQELATHNELRAPMRAAFSARHANGARAMHNWEKKSSYLLREIVKWRTYVEGLREAAERRKVVEERREKERAEKGEAGEEMADAQEVEQETAPDATKVEEIPA